MGGTTTPLAFPYPTGSDRVADGDNAIQALAEAVDNYAAPDNRTTAAGVTPAAGWSIGPHMRVRRVGDLVCVTVDCSKASWAAGEGVALLPNGFRPGSNVHTVGIQTANSAIAPFHVNTNGYIVATTAAGGGGILGSVTFPAATGTAEDAPVSTDALTNEGADDE